MRESTVRHRGSLRLREEFSRFCTSVDGLSPEHIALLISVGLVLGVFPVAGIPTILCLAAAFGLRLNFAALQLLNHVSTPLQLALLLPLARAGYWLSRGALSADSTVAGRLGAAALHAVAGWACICVPVGVLLYAILVLLLRRGRRPWFNSVKSPA